MSVQNVQSLNGVECECELRHILTHSYYVVDLGKNSVLPVKNVILAVVPLRHT